MGDDFSLVKSRGMRRRLDMHRLADSQDIDSEAEEPVLDSLDDMAEPVHEEQPEQVLEVQEEVEEAEQSDLEFCRSEKERIYSEIGEDSASRVRIFVIGGLIALVGIFSLIGALGDKKGEEKAVAALPYTRFQQEEVVAAEQTFTDSMKISKYVELENGSLLLFLEGKPEHFGQQVRIPVTPAVYNMVSNGDVAKITYQIVQISSDTGTSDKAVNLKIKSVQEGL